MQEDHQIIVQSDALLANRLNWAGTGYGRDDGSDKLNLTFRSLPCSVTSVPLGKQNLDGQEIDLPPVLLGEYGADPKKKTILVYGQSTLPAPSRLLELT